MRPIFNAILAHDTKSNTRQMAKKAQLKENFDYKNLYWSCIRFSPNRISVDCVF